VVLEPQIVPNNGGPTCGLVDVEIDHSIPLTYHRYDVQLGFHSSLLFLLETDMAVSVTVEQDGTIKQP
jgi:hypothetical protein